MRLGLGLGMGFTSGFNRAAFGASKRNPALLLQTEIIARGDSTSEGVLIRASALPWLEIVSQLRKDPDFLKHFAHHPRKFEEFIAATYERAGFDEVILTPQRGDKGRDVIATKRGFGSVRFLEQAKAYSPGHLVTHDDIRAMLGVVNLDHGASKGLVTTTSDFQPGIRGPNSEFQGVMPGRLELKNGTELIAWLETIETKKD